MIAKFYSFSNRVHGRSWGPSGGAAGVLRWLQGAYDGKRALTLKLSIMASARLERKLVGGGLGRGGLPWGWARLLYLIADLVARACLRAPFNDFEAFLLCVSR